MRKSALETTLIVLVVTGFVASVAASELLQVQSTPLVIVVRAFTFVLSVFNLLVIARIEKVSPTLIFSCFAAFWTLYLGRILMETLVFDVQLSRSDFTYWSFAVGASLLPCLAMMSIRSVSAIHSSYYYLFGILSICTVLALIFGSTSSRTGLFSYETGRLSLASLNPISMGHMALSLLILSLWHLQMPASDKVKFWSFFCFCTIPLSLYVLVAAASRGPVVALFCVAIFYQISRGVKAFALTAIVAVLLLYSFVELGSYLEKAGEYQMLGRLESSIRGDDRGVSGRIIAYKGAVAQFSENPLFGSALEERRTGKYPHNIILEALMATGILGGLFLCGTSIFLLYTGVSIVRQFRDVGWVSLLYVQYFVGALFSGAIWGSTYFWAFFGLSFCLYRIATKRELSSEEVNHSCRQM